MISYGIYPSGKRKALTMSYDDCGTQDVRLIDILDKYSIRGTFHINSGLLENPRHNPKEKIKEIYKNHEIAVHGVKHKTLDRLY